MRRFGGGGGGVWFPQFRESRGARVITTATKTQIAKPSTFFYALCMNFQSLNVRVASLFHATSPFRSTSWRSPIAHQMINIDLTWKFILGKGCNEWD